MSCRSKVAVPKEIFYTQHRLDKDKVEYTDTNECILPHKLEYIVHDTEELHKALENLNCINTTHKNNDMRSFDIRYDKDINGLVGG